MNTQFKALSLFVLIMSAVVLAAFIPQQDNRNKKNEQQQQNQDKNKGKAKQNQGKNDPGANKGKENANANTNANSNQGKPDNRDDKNMKQENKGVGKKDIEDGYSWDRETFKDRQKIKNQGKVTVCHKFNRANDPAVTIRVSSNALKAHMAHGDVMGDCPVVSRGRFSDFFLRRRADYYNELYNGQDQVIYSRSILDYALARLADSRQQLVVYRANNMPVAEIERKEVVVVELERNVSLLESLIGVAANVIASRLQ
jgi:hypothetical protein